MCIGRQKQGEALYNTFISVSNYSLLNETEVFKYPIQKFINLKRRWEIALY